MRTVILGPRPPEIDAFLARRRALGQDHHDEVWEGDYHVVPAAHPRHSYVDKRLAVLLAPFEQAAGLVGTSEFNLGTPDDYRVPDGGYHRRLPPGVFVPTAAIVVEVLSPDDDTWVKFDFYARHGVDEVCVADPIGRAVRWFALTGTTYEEAVASRLLGVTAADLVAGIHWP